MSAKNDSGACVRAELVVEARVARRCGQDAWQTEAAGARGALHYFADFVHPDCDRMIARESKARRLLAGDHEIVGEPGRPEAPLDRKARLIQEERVACRLRARSGAPVARARIGPHPPEASR